MFIEILDALLSERGLSRNKMLNDLGLNKSSALNWESRGTIPSGDVLSKIADYFDVSVDYLLGRTESPKQSNPETKKEPTKLSVLYNRLDDTDRIKALAYMEGLLSADKYVSVDVSVESFSPITK